MAVISIRYCVWRCDHARQAVGAVGGVLSAVVILPTYDCSGHIRFAKPG